MWTVRALSEAAALSSAVADRADPSARTKSRSACGAGGEGPVKARLKSPGQLRGPSTSLVKKPGDAAFFGVGCAVPGAGGASAVRGTLGGGGPDGDAPATCGERISIAPV